jgi:hypothetical protein
MDKQELDEQFQKMEGDKQVQAAAAGTPPEPEKKKRITVAELNTTMNELMELVNTDVFDWLEKLNTKVQHFENAEAEKPDTLPESVIRRFEKMEKGIAILLENQNSLLNAYTSISEDIASLPSPATTKDIAARLDTLESVTDAIADALRQHPEAAQPGEPAATQEMKFAEPPQQTADGQIEPSSITAVASVCQTMTDVLMICRALEKTPGLTDAERNGILDIACRSSGVILAPGLQIRAGVKFSGA